MKAPFNETEPAETTREPTGWWSVLRPLVLRVHFYAGVLIAPLLLVTATTGLLYVFTPQLEQAVHAHQLHVPASGAQRPIAEQVEAARTAHPQDEPALVWPAQGPTDTTRVIFDPPEFPESYYRTVFVNPHNSEIRGELDTYGDGQSLPVRTWFDQLHRNLHLGEPGRIYSELAASWLWVVVLGGLLLWFGQRRRALGTRGFLLPGAGPPGRARTRSWHGAVGLWISVGLLFLSATGLTWSTFAGGHVARVKSALDSDTPSVSTSSIVGAGGGDIGIDRVLHIARNQGLHGPVQITLPEEGAAYSVKQTRRLWPTQQDEVAVHPATGEVTDVVRFEDYPLLAKLSRWGIDAHMGLLFGWVNQIALALLISGLIVVITRGYRMWWLRRPTRKSGFSFGPPPMRAVWRQVPGKVLAPIVLVIAVIGYVLPLLGISLLAFLVLDHLLARRKARDDGSAEVAS